MMNDLEKVAFEVLWMYCCTFGFYTPGTNRGMDDALAILKYRA
jgi:hypothetical protein